MDGLDTQTGPAFPLYPDPFAFTWNLQQGSRRWRDSLGRVRGYYPDGSSVSEYGVDVVVIGDSTATYGNVFGSWPHALKVMMQERFNRSGVVGGYGFVPFSTLNSTLNDWTVANLYTFTVTSANATVGATYANNGQTFTVAATIAAQTTLLCTGPAAPSSNGTLTKTSGSGDASIAFSGVVATNWTTIHNAVGSEGGTGLCRLTANNATGPVIYRYWGPTTPAGVWQRQGITDWQFVGVGGFGAPNYNSIFCDSSTSNGPIAPSHSVSNAVGGYGLHWTLQSGLNAAVAHTIQVSPTSTDKVDGSGVILYNGDYNEGVRLHNLGSVGSNTQNWLSGAAGDSNQTQVVAANIDNFSTGGNGGAINAKLFLIVLGLNDCGATSTLIPLANYVANLQTLITAIVSEPSMPCVGLVVNIPWSSTVANNAQLAAYASYMSAAYQLASANDHVFVIDFWKVLTDSTHPQYAPHGVNSSGGAVHDRGWYNDGTHLLDTGNFARARMVFSAVSYGS